MEILRYHNKSDDAANIVESVNANHNLTDADLVVILESEDYSNRTEIDKIFKKPAFFWNARKNKKMNKNDVPERIFQVMSQENCKYLIWLSKETIESQPIRLTWLYAHEVRHYLQSQDLSIVLELEKKLKSIHESENFNGKGVTKLECPGELDCELFAEKTIKQAFTEEEYLGYISNERSKQNGNVYYDRLDYLSDLLCV